METCNKQDLIKWEETTCKNVPSEKKVENSQENYC